MHWSEFQELGKVQAFLAIQKCPLFLSILNSLWKTTFFYVFFPIFSKLCESLFASSPIELSKDLFKTVDF